MSWQDYVDTSLVGTGKIAHAAIFGHDGAIWAQSASFSLAPEEIACLLRAYAEPSTLYEHGLTLAGTRVQSRAIRRSAALPTHLPTHLTFLLTYPPTRLPCSMCICVEMTVVFTLERLTSEYVA